MVQTAISSRTFDRIERARFFHDQNPRVVAFLVETEFAQIAFGDVAALAAKRKTVFNGPHRVSQSQRVFPLGLQQMERQSLSGFLSDTGKADQLPNKPREQSLLIDSHRRPIYNRPGMFMPPVTAFICSAIMS